MLVEKLSCSSLGTFNQCPYKFYIMITKGLPQVDSVHLDFGTAIHGVLEKFYKASNYNEEFKSLDYLLDIYKTDAIKVLQKYKEFLKLNTTAKLILNSYYTKNCQNKINKAIEVEKYFSIDLPGFRAVGKKDRIDKLDDIDVIVDYKTGKVPDKDIKEDLQVKMYAMHYFYDTKNLEKKTKIKVLIDYIKFNEQLTCEFDDSIVQPVIDELVIKHKEITNTKDFLPKPNNFCFNCEIHKECPFFAKPESKKICFKAYNII